MATSYSLFELNEYIKRVMALNFQEAIWVRCEVSQASISRGSVYLNIVELEENTEVIKAQASAVIWPRSYIFLQNKLKELLPYMLEAGSEVLIKVKVDFHERYGLKLVIEDIDPTYTLGQAEMARQKIIERLKSEKLLKLNDHIPISPVLQSIAVISSETAAGYADFIHQIQHNRFGYEIHTELFNVAVQGRNVENDVVEAFRQIQSNNRQYDAVAIIRGGGSKLDLAGFDNYNIGYAIATCKIPVIVGIGHEIDTTVADMVAQLSLKTPTAVAGFIIDKNMHYETSLLEIGADIQQICSSIIRSNDANINYIEQNIRLSVLTRINTENLSLKHMQDSIKISSKNTIQQQHQYLQNTESLIKLADPIRTLQRGFSIIQQNGKSVSSVNDFKKAEPTKIILKDGEVTIN